VPLDHNVALHADGLTESSLAHSKKLRSSGLAFLNGEFFKGYRVHLLFSTKQHQVLPAAIYLSSPPVMDTYIRRE